MLKYTLDVKDYLHYQSDAIFLIDEKTGTSYTYQQFHASALAIAGFLTEQGLQLNDRLVVVMDNSVLLAKLYFACLYVGITVIPVSPCWTNEQIKYVLIDSHASFLLTEARHHFAFPELTLTTIVITDKITTQLHHYSMVSLEHFSPITFYDDLHDDNLAIITYTAGTNTQLQGVMHTVADLVGNALLFSQALKINHKNRFYHVLPMTYFSGYYHLLIIPYLARASVVISTAFHSSTIQYFWDSAQKYKVNTLWLVSTIMTLLLELDENPNSLPFCKENILLALVATRPLSRLLKQNFEIKYGISLQENFYLDETLFMSAHLINQPVKGMGKILKGIDLKIVNHKNETLTAGKEGEIVVKTPAAMLGYLGSENIFNKIRDEWFYTGEIGYLDAENYLYVTGQMNALFVKRTHAIHYLQTIGLNCLSEYSSCYLFVSIAPSRLEADEFCMHLLNQQCIIPGIIYSKNCDQYIRVSLNTEPLERIYLVLDKIKVLIEETTSKNVLSLNQTPVSVVA